MVCVDAGSDARQMVLYGGCRSPAAWAVNNDCSSCLQTLGMVCVVPLCGCHRGVNVCRCIMPLND
jgi:hypothetical protein